MLYLSVPRSLQDVLGFEKRKPCGVKTTELLKGTYLETVGCQTQRDRLNARVENCAEAERQKEGMSVFEVLAEVAVRMILGEEANDECDVDMSPAGQGAKSLRSQV